MTTTSNPSGMAQNVTNQALEMGEMALDAATDAGAMVTQTAREYPIVTGVMIAGVAFALGALWKSGSLNRRSGMHAYMDSASNAMNSYLPKHMRF